MHTLRTPEPPATLPLQIAALVAALHAPIGDWGVAAILVFTGHLEPTEAGRRALRRALAEISAERDDAGRLMPRPGGRPATPRGSGEDARLGGWAHGALADAARDWRTLRSGPAARLDPAGEALDYLAAHGLQHLRDEGRLDDLAASMSDGEGLAWRLQRAGKVALKALEAAFAEEGPGSPRTPAVDSWRKVWDASLRVCRRARDPWPAERVLVQRAWEAGPDTPAGADVRAWSARSLVGWPILAAEHTLSMGRAKVAGVAVDGRGELVAVAGKDGSLSVFEVATGECICHPAGHTLPADWIGLTADGTRLVSVNFATADHPGQTRVYDARSGVCLATPALPVTCATRGPGHGGEVVLGCPDGSVWALGTAGGDLRNLLLGPGGPVQSVALHPGGRGVIAARDDGSVELWGVQHDGPIRLHERELRGSEPPAGRVPCEVAAAADGRGAVALTEGGAFLWDAASGLRLANTWHRVGRLRAHPERPWVLAASAREVTVLGTAALEPLGVLAMRGDIACLDVGATHAAIGAGSKVVLIRLVAAREAPDPGPEHLHAAEDLALAETLVAVATLAGEPLPEDALARLAVRLGRAGLDARVAVRRAVAMAGARLVRTISPDGADALEPAWTGPSAAAGADPAMVGALGAAAASIGEEETEAALAIDPAGALRRHLLRRGVPHLLRAGRVQAAAALLASPAWLAQRLDAEGPAGAWAVAEDLRRAADAAGPTPAGAELAGTPTGGASWARPAGPCAFGTRPRGGASTSFWWASGSWVRSRCTPTGSVP